MAPRRLAIENLSFPASLRVEVVACGPMDADRPVDSGLVEYWIALCFSLFLGFPIEGESLAAVVLQNTAKGGGANTKYYVQ